jgi:perosamine synthetase
LIQFYPPPFTLEEQSALVKTFEETVALGDSPIETLEKSFTDLCEVKHAIAVSSGSAALQVALIAHNIRDGDEVITPSFTSIATINAILSVGARPVFVDIDETTYHIRSDLIEERLSSRTRAILTVHLFGQMCEMDGIQDIAGRYGLTLIEDACQAIGAKYYGKMAGSIGTGAFSLSPESIVNSIGGGVITTNDEEVAKRCKMVRNRGLDSNEKLVMLGLDFRIKDHQAVIAGEKLRNLPDNIERRRANARYLNSNIKSVIIPIEAEGRLHTWNYYTVCVTTLLERNAVVRRLHDAGITTDMVYWKPAHTFNHVQDIVGEIYLPVTEKVACEAFSLPIHEYLSTEELEKIVTEVNKL